MTNPQWFTPVLATALVVVGLYLRIRRSIGRQPLRSRRLGIRAGLLGAIGIVLLVSLLRHPPQLEALLAGMALGLALGHLALRHTQFEVTAQGRFYTSHPWIGALVTAVFVARILYRLFMLQGGGTAASAAATPGQVFANRPGSAFTLAVFGLLVGYYVWFNLGVLRKARTLGTAAPDSDTPAH